MQNGDTHVPVLGKHTQRFNQSHDQYAFTKQNKHLQWSPRLHTTAVSTPSQSEMCEREIRRKNLSELKDGLCRTLKSLVHALNKYPIHGNILVHREGHMATIFKNQFYITVMVCHNIVKLPVNSTKKCFYINALPRIHAVFNNYPTI